MRICLIRMYLLETYFKDFISFAFVATSMASVLAQLRLLGLCCPCIESEEDQAARISTLSLQGLTVKWYRLVNPLPSPVEAKKNVEKAVDNGVGKTLGSLISKGMQVLSDQNVSLTSYVGIESTLSIVDSPFGPSLQVTPNWGQTEEHDFADTDDNGADRVGFRRLAATKTVLLSDVDEVSPGDSLNQRGRVCCDVRIHGKPQAFQLVMSGRKLLQLDIHQSVIHNVKKDEVITHLHTLLNWNNLRISKMGVSSGDRFAAPGDFVRMEENGNAGYTKEQSVLS